MRNKMLKVMHGWPMRPSVHHFFGFRAPKLEGSPPGAGEGEIRRAPEGCREAKIEEIRTCR